MVELIELLGNERREAGREPIRIGIGVATGEMVAGYTGTQQRATYTCIGDTVNLAARLEAHTKVALRAILVDAETCAALGDRIATERLGPVAFRGKALPVEVFAVATSAAGGMRRDEADRPRCRSGRLRVRCRWREPGAAGTCAGRRCRCTLPLAKFTSQALRSSSLPGRMAQNGCEGVCGNAFTSMRGFFFAVLSTRPTSSSLVGIRHALASALAALAAVVLGLAVLERLQLAGARLAVPAQAFGAAAPDELGRRVGHLLAVAGDRETILALARGGEQGEQRKRSDPRAGAWPGAAVS